MENEACGFSDFDRGVMRQKMAIFKEENSVCRGTKNFEWRNFHEFHRGTMRQKMAIFKEGNSVCRGPKFCKGRCWWKSSFYWRKIGRTLPNLEYFWMGAMLMKIVILLKENWSHITKFWIFLNGGDVDENRHIMKFWIFFNRGDVVENRDFINGKVVAHGQNF